MRHYKQIPKKLQDKLTREVQAFLAEKGAIPDLDKYYNFNTIYGPLRLTIDEHPFILFTIFARFDNSPSHPDANPYSGKWNWHYNYNEATADNPLAFFKTSLEKILVTA